MREIDGRSVMDAAAGTIKKLIGPGGLFYEISQLAETLGLSADPAAMIIDGLDAVTGWLVGLNSFLNTFRAKIVRGVIDPVDFDLGKITSSIGAFAGGLFDRLSSAINSMDVTVIGNRLGLGIAAAIDGIVSFVRNVDFLAIGNAFLKLGMVGVYAIGTAMANVDYGAIAMMWFKGLKTRSHDCNSSHRRVYRRRQRAYYRCYCRRRGDGYRHIHRYQELLGITRRHLAVCNG